MKAYFISSLVLLTCAFPVHAKSSCEKKHFTYKYKSDVFSFITSNAYALLKDKANSEGYTCSSEYQDSVRTTIFGNYVATVEADCYKAADGESHYDCEKK